MTYASDVARSASIPLTMETMMKFRDIAKLHAYNHGLKTQITAADLDYYNGVLGEEGGSTPGRVDKANAALDALAGQLSKKWGLSKKFVNADVPARAEAPGEDE